MIPMSADSRGLLPHTPPPMVSVIPTPTHTILYALQNCQTLDSVWSHCIVLTAPLLIRKYLREEMSERGSMTVNRSMG